MKKIGKKKIKAHVVFLSLEYDCLIDWRNLLSIFH